MTSPTAPIDADLGEWDKKSYFALEEDGISRKFLKTVGATWAKVYDPATQFTGGEFGKFVRIRCAPGTPTPILYALGYGVEATLGDTQPFILRSENNGLTWSQNWIDEVLTLRSFTVTHKISPLVSGGAGVVRATHTRLGDDIAPINPLGVAYKFHWDLPGGMPWCYYWVDGNSIMDDTGSWGADWAPELLHCFVNSGMPSPAAWNTLHAWLTENGDFGLAHDTQACGMSRPRDGTDITHAWSGGVPYSTCYVDSWVLWNKPSVSMPAALDVARANPNVLFVGLRDKIKTSTNGGFDFADCVTAHGAYDICVDPQLGGVIYYWDTDGNLRCAVAGVPQTPLLTGDASGETGGFLRIARDFNTGKVLAIHNGDLKLRNLAVWSTQKSGLLDGRGLRAFYASPTKLACLDNSDIYLSLDAGATFANKKGGWSGYANPRTIHLLEAT